MVVAWSVGANAVSSEITWVQDTAWFRDRVASDVARAGRHRGCCPAAVQLYSQRLEENDFRCCSRRLDEIGALRPVGGATWAESVTLGLPQNATMTLVGDSITEQYFLALLCLAWVSPTHRIAQMPTLARTGGNKTLWTRAEGAGATWTARIEPGGVALEYVRLDKPILDLLPPDVIERLRTVPVLIVGTFHYWAAFEQAMSELVQRLDRCGSTAHADSRVTHLTEYLPTHFPGGKYRSPADIAAGARYMYARASVHAGSAVCDTVHNRSVPDKTRLNSALRRLASRTGGLGLLRLAHMFGARGSAHIGPLRGHDSRADRDCLHWCVAPGVFDGLVLSMLAQLARGSRSPLLRRPVGTRPR
jgi:hypothetical protein